METWRQIQRGNFTRLEPLAEFLELEALARTQLLAAPRFPLNLPKRLADKIEKNRLDDPILRQFVPLVDETHSQPGFTADPVQDQTFRAAPKLLHKYHGRALLLATSGCAMHCRYCFRQNFPYETTDRSFDAEIAYLASNPTLTEVILSGGDPLSLSDPALASLFTSLHAIPHLRRIRFHTRFPIGIPERINTSFLSLLATSPQQIYFIIHSNHPRELDPDVISALKKIQTLGIPVLNQSVLLKGVNDDEETLLALCTALVDAGITPYYLHQLDPVAGAAHFDVSDEKATSLLRHVQENLSGFGVPRLVREEPNRLSKSLITSCRQS